MLNYFKELLNTLKQILHYQEKIEQHLAKLASTVSTGYGGKHSVLRTGKNQYDE